MGQAIIAASATINTSRLTGTGRTGTPGVMEITTIGMTTGIVHLTMAVTKDTASPEATVIDPPA